MVIIPFLAKQFVEQIGSTVDDKVMLDEVLCRVDTTKNLDDSQAIECAVLGMDRRQALLDTLASRRISLLDIQGVS